MYALQKGKPRSLPLRTGVSRYAVAETPIGAGPAMTGVCRVSLPPTIDLDCFFASRCPTTMQMFDDSTAAKQTLAHDDALRFLQRAAHLLLEYNMRTELLRNRLQAVAKVLDVPVHVDIGYRTVTLHTPHGSLHAQAHEIRINVAVNAAVMAIVDAVTTRSLPVREAIDALDNVVTRAPRHNRWILALIFGLAASALGTLQSGDLVAIVTVGVASALGLLARQELAKRHVALFALPFTAALIGSVLGGLVIAAGWTITPGICLIVPALMLVPGPHLINTLYDAIENNLQTAIPRLGLAAGILLAAAAGIFLGGWLTLPPGHSNVLPITLATDILLAGIAACGFGAFYNEPWRVLWTSIVCGMVGHGVRYLSLKHGMPLETATLLACFSIGMIASVLVQRLKVQFAAVAFAGAVPMMPGVFMYQGIGGAMQIALAGSDAAAGLLSVTLFNIFKASFVVGAMGIGLLLGDKVATLMRGRAV
jgi:uncharacterized membrane protein YjjP (DUF1212 family)